MTAEIVIMNKEAVVLAADSAVTIGEGIKILNTANKVFMLIPKCPIGILIYNNSTLMDVPWEIIIKEYRDYAIKENLGFSDLVEYPSSFLDFVEKNGFRYVSDDQESKFFAQMVFSEYGEILRTIWNEMRKIFYGNAEISDREIKQIASSTIMKFHDEWSGCHDILQEKKSKELRRKLQLKYEKTINEFIVRGFEKFTLSKKVLRMLTEIALFTVSKIEKKRGQTPLYTGLVFSGYGKNNLFPVCVNYEVYCYLCGTLVFLEKDKARVGFSKGDVSSIIMPFAQKDVTLNLLRGILPNYRMELESKLIGKFDKKEVASILQDVDKTVWDNHTKPIMDVVEILPKDELASVARTLVNLTSFMRHVSYGIETVGGPVDVAVISKKDGFIWIDRKHYFEIEKNIHFGYDKKGDIHVEANKRKRQRSKEGV